MQNSDLTVRDDHELPAVTETVSPEQAMPLLSQLRGHEGSVGFVQVPPSPPASGEEVVASQKMNVASLGRLVINEDGFTISFTRLASIVFLIVVTIVSLIIICAPEEEEGEPQKTREDNASARRGYESVPAMRPEELAVLKTGDGTWARTYQEADPITKQGLELLLRCRIVPLEEFAHSKVTQEHISESVWIATRMLRLRPLEEWLKAMPEAKAVFQQCVAECFQAKKEKHAKKMVYDGGTGGSGSTGQTPLQGGSLDTTFGSTGYTVPAPQVPQASQAPRASPAPMQVFPPTRGQAGATSPSVVLKTPADSKKLVERVRQLMASSDARKRTSTTPPSTLTHMQAQEVAEKASKSAPANMETGGASSSNDP